MARSDRPSMKELKEKCLLLPELLRDDLVRKCALLYALLTDPDSPAWVKGAIVAALVYFLSPLDTIPDVLPIIGYTDDLAVIAATLAAMAVATSDPKVKSRADKIASRFRSGA